MVLKKYSVLKEIFSQKLHPENSIKPLVLRNWPCFFHVMSRFGKVRKKSIESCEETKKMLFNIEP